MIIGTLTKMFPIKNDQIITRVDNARNVKRISLFFQSELLNLKENMRTGTSIKLAIVRQPKPIQ